jgi:hypothetical protein
MAHKKLYFIWHNTTIQIIGSVIYYSS